MRAYREDLDYDLHIAEVFRERCRPADPILYAAWVANWIRRGGKVRTTPNPIPMSLRVIEIREPVDFIPDMCGALSRVVLVPTGVMTPAEVRSAAHHGLGHSTFLFMDGFEWMTRHGFEPDIMAYRETLEILPMAVIEE